MDYYLFSLRVGKLDVPTQEQIDTLIYGVDTVHLLLNIPYEELPNGGRYTKDLPEDEVNKLFDSWRLIRERGAKRGQDYIVTGYERSPQMFEIGIHTTHKFFSPEDE